jgi:hypothetical protein
MNQNYAGVRYRSGAMTQNTSYEPELTWQEVKWQILIGIHNLREDN